jgi:TolA-binding protein
MDTLNLITVRRAEVEQQLDRLQSQSAKLQQELADLQTAERVLNNLTGAKRSTSGEADKSKPKNASEARPTGAPAMPVMIFTVLREAYRQGRVGLEPREIADAVDAKEGWGPINRDVIRTRTWRLAKDGKIKKDGTVYSLIPENEKPVDAESDQDTPTGLFSTSRPVEPVPGGGT